MEQTKLFFELEPFEAFLRLVWPQSSICGRFGENHPFSVALMDSAIFKLAVSGHFERSALEKVIESVNSLSCLKSSPLHYAVLGGNVDTVQFLVERGARVDSRNSFGETPLHWACKEGKESIVRLLLHKKASPNVLDTERNSPMHWCSEYDNAAAIQLLIQNGGFRSFFVRNEEGLNPLRIAKTAHSKRAIRVLSALTLPDLKKECK